MIEEQLDKIRNLIAAASSGEEISQEAVSQAIKAVKIELAEFGYHVSGVYRPVGPVIDGSVICPQDVSGTYTTGAQPARPTFDEAIEEVRRLPPPPNLIKINARMMTQLRAIVPARPATSWETLYGVDVEIDDTVPDGMMRVGDDVLPLGK